MNENFCILIRISLKFIHKGPIDNKPALVQVMAWRQAGIKPIHEPMLTKFTDIYVALGGDELTQCAIKVLDVSMISNMWTLNTNQGFSVFK